MAMDLANPGGFSQDSVFDDLDCNDNTPVLQPQTLHPFTKVNMATGYDSSSRLPQNKSSGRLQDSRTIEVRNFNPTTSDETFETFFENKRRSGGGDIEKIDGDDRETGIIRVTFVEPEVAEHVLRRSDLMLDEAQLQLSPLQPPEQLIWDRKTIEVHGLNPSSSQDAIELFFESKRRSGGDVVEDMYLDTDSNVAVVTFQEPEVAERVLQMPSLVLNEATLTVRPKEHISSEHSTTDDTDYQRNEDPATAERAEIQSVSSGISFECFEDEEQDQSGSDDDIATLGDSGENTHGTPLEPGERTVSTNGSSGIVADIFTIEELDLCFGGEDNLTIGNSRDVTGGTHWEPGLQHHKEHTQPDGVSDAARPSLQILRIHGFTPATSKEAVEMFLENKSGETELESCDYDIGAGVAIVAFKNPQGAAKLMSLEHLTLGGAQLSITPLHDAYAGLDVEFTRPRAVRVCGIAKDTSREFLSLFFENRRMSGGGDIEELEYDNDQGVAIITYIDPESARSVVEKQPLKVNNTEVQVTLMTPQQALPVVLGPVEESTVLVTGLAAACTSDDLKKYFTKTSLHNEIQHITFSQRPGVAMLTFTSPPDFDSLRVLCLMRPLRDTMLSVHRVPTSRVVQVHNIGSVSQDMLTLYFDSKKHSGGGKVVHVTVHREHNYALIEVEDSAIVHDIVARGCHKLDDQSLHVTVYYEDLGPIFPCHDALTSADKIVVSGFNSDILNFVHRSPTSRHIVDNMMAEVAADVGWDNYSSLDPSVELTCVTGNWKKIAHTFDTDWKQTVEDTFLGLLQKVFASEDVHIPNEIWMDFLQRISYVDSLDSNRIVVEVKDQECRVSVFGLTDEVDNILRRLNGDRAKLQPGTSQTATKTVRNLKEHQLRMLNATGFKGNVQKQFPDLIAIIDHRARSVCFTGMSESIASAKADMSATFKSMTSTQMDMSVALIKVITGTVMVKDVVQGFKRMNIRAVFQAVGKKKLGVWALNKENLTIACKVIESCVVVKKIVADLTAIQSAQNWKALLDRVKSDHEGLLEVTETEDGITVSGAAKRVELAIKCIHDFLVQQIIVEKFVIMKHGIVDYMAKYMKKEVNDVRIAFRDDNIKVTPKTDGPCGFVVKGRKTGLDGAVHKLRALADCVKVNRCKVDKPGASAFLSSGDGKRAIGRLQAQHKVVIESVVTITLPGGVTVEVVQENLTRFRTDAIVNTANEQLDHFGGLAKAIVTAGGQQIQKKCHAYVREHGKLQPGQVFVSTPGKLPCKELIHAVAPVWRGGESDEVNALSDAISASMTKAEQLGLSSIAFPALSSGVYGFPLDTCTLTIVAALRDFLENHKHTCVKKVSLLDRSEEITKSFESSVGIIFGSRLAMTSGDTSAGDDTAQSKATASSPSAKTSRKRSRRRSVSCTRGSASQQQQQQSISGTFDIFGQTPAAIARAVKALKQMCDKECAVIVLNKKSDMTAIAKLTNRQMSQIRSLEDKLGVKIDINKTPSHQRIVIRGAAANTSQAHAEILQIFIDVVEGDGKEKVASVISKQMATDLPANWSSMGNMEHMRLEELQTSSREFQSVKDKFVNSAQGTVTAVSKIERVQNPGLYRQYMLRKEEMKKRKQQPAVIERSLWHGTGSGAVQNINMGGFNRSYCGKNATAYGNGVYFAVSSEYSTRDTYATPDVYGEKRVYKSLVLTGDYILGKSTYRVPPDNPSVPGLKYDTVVNDVNSPGIFVIFLDNQAYPEYLITFS